MIRDRDVKFTAAADAVVASVGIDFLPNRQPIADERLGRCRDYSHIGRRSCWRLQVDEVVIGPKLWAEITSLARRRGERLLVVAYIGQDAPQLVKPRSTDHVVADASERTVRSGQTSPSALLAWKELGATVESLEDLHAKVMIFGDSVVLGSPNLSRHSHDCLLEAAVVATDGPLARRARHAVTAFLNETRHRRVELDVHSLHLLQKIYNTERSTPVRQRRRAGTTHPALQPTGRVFVIGIEPDTPLRRDERKIINQRLTELGPPARFTRNWMRLDRRWSQQLRPGDTLITYDEERANAPSLLLDVVKHPDGRRRRIALLLDDRDLTPVDRHAFDEVCFELKVDDDGEIRSTHAKAGLLAPFGLDGVSVVKGVWSLTVTS